MHRARVFRPESWRDGITRPWVFDGANSPAERQTRYRVALPGITLINFIHWLATVLPIPFVSRDRCLVFAKFTNSFRRSNSYDSSNVERFVPVKARRTLKDLNLNLPVSATTPSLNRRAQSNRSRRKIIRNYRHM